MSIIFNSQKKANGVPQIVFDQLLDNWTQSSAFTLPKLCLMVLNIIFGDRNLKVKSHNRKLAKSREN